VALHFPRASEKQLGLGFGKYPAYETAALLGASLARASRFLTEDTCHLPPRAERMPRWFSASLMSRRVTAPVLRIASMIGIKPATNSSAAVV